MGGQPQEVVAVAAGGAQGGGGPIQALGDELEVWKCPRCRMARGNYRQSFIKKHLADHDKEEEKARLAQRDREVRRQQEAAARGGRGRGNNRRGARNRRYNH